MPDASPLGLEANLEGDILYLSWFPPSFDAINGELLGYELICNGQDGHRVVTRNVSISQANIAVRNDTHYTCEVCAYTVIGCGPNATIHISTYNNCKLTAIMNASLMYVL